MLLAKHMGRGYRVLDLACGKGGDMLKFKAGGCGHYVGMDIALASVRDAVRRYNGAAGRQSMPFPANFYAGDFCDPALEGALPAGLLFHLVSCQFACHYAFASEERAEALLRNVSSRLLPGGVFAGTTADANVLVRSYIHTIHTHMHPRMHACLHTYSRQHPGTLHVYHTYIYPCMHACLRIYI